MRIRPIDLSFGQLAWALNGGAHPDRLLQDQLNYLRQLGIPLEVRARRWTRGHRRRYGFAELIETGVALYALRQHVKPADVKRVLVGNRAALHALFQKTLEALPQEVPTASWEESGDAGVPLVPDEIWLRLHDRFAKAPGHFDVLGPRDLHVPEGANSFDLMLRFLGPQIRGVVPVTRLILGLTDRAQRAPDIKPGPKS